MAEQLMVDGSWLMAFESVSILSSVFYQFIGVVIFGGFLWRIAFRRQSGGFFSPDSHRRGRDGRKGSR